MPYWDGVVAAPVLRQETDALPQFLSLPPIPIETNHPVPSPSLQYASDVEMESESSSEESDDSDDPVYQPAGPSAHPSDGLISQGVFDSLVSICALTQKKGEALGSALRNLGCLESGVKTGQRKRSHVFDQFFNTQRVVVQLKAKRGTSEPTTKEVDVVYCSNIPGLFEQLNQQYSAGDYRLFLDGSRKSFKALLLQNEPDGNKRKPAIPIAESDGMPESYQAIKTVLELLHYDDHQWFVQGDFKVINILTGLKGGGSKYPCYLCNFDSRDYARHFETDQWAPWTEDDREPGRFSFVERALVPADRIVLPELHVRMGVFQQFVKKLFENSAHPAYQYYVTKFRSKYSEAKLAVGALIGPDIIRLSNDFGFVEALQQGGQNDSENKELRAWLSFVEVVNSFFGKNTRPDDFRERVGDLLNSFSDMGCNLSLKLHFLADHLDAFPTRLADWSEQHGEKGHQEMREAARLYPASGIRRLAERLFQIRPLPASLKHSSVGPQSNRF